MCSSLSFYGSIIQKPAQIQNASSPPPLSFDSCLVCFSTTLPSNSFISCSHRFHLECIKEWTAVEQTCPECLVEISSLYMETPDDCELFHLQRIREHFSRKKLSRLSPIQLKGMIAELIDRSKDENIAVRHAFQEILTAKHLIKFLKLKKKRIQACKTDYLLQITNRHIIHCRKALQMEYQVIFNNERPQQQPHEKEGGDA